MTDEKHEAKAGSRGPVVLALGYGESGADLVRAASALARDAGAALACLTIETGERISSEEGERMDGTLRLARELGAAIASAPGIDAAAGVLSYAREHSASAIVVGQGRTKLLGRGMAERLRVASPACSVVSVLAPRSKAARPTGGWRRLLDDSLGGCAAAVLIIAVVTALNLPLADYAGYWAAAVPYLAAISLMALALDRWAVLLAAFLSAAAWDYLFIPPRFTMRISRTEDILMLGLYFFVAICSGWMTARLRASERLLASREARLRRLSALGTALAGAKTIGQIVASGVEAIEEACKVEAIFILRGEGGELKTEAESGWEPLDRNARLAARLCLAEGRATGRFTDAFPESEWHFVAMEGPLCRLGVVGARAAHDRRWDEAAENFLRTLATSVSIAVAREIHGST